MATAALTLRHADAPATLTDSSGTHSVPAVEKMFSILQVLARSHTGMTMRDLAKLCCLPKSSVHGIIVTLERCGYLHRSERNGRYLFDRKLLLLGNQALRGMELRDQIEPHMRTLARRAGLSVHAGIVESDEAVVIARIDTLLKSRLAGSFVGKRSPLHCSALGKALAAQWSDSRLERYASERGLAPHNENTISSLKRFKSEMAKVRSQGYAIDDEEDVLGFRGIGAPLFGANGEMSGAICISGTTNEITIENFGQLAAMVTEASRYFSQTKPAVAEKLAAAGF